MTRSRSLQAGSAGRFAVFAAAALLLLILALTCREPAERPGIAMNGIDWNALSRDGQASLSGTAPAGARISLSADGEPIAEILPEAGGRWSFSGQLPQGTQSIIATALNSEDGALGSAVLTREPEAQNAGRPEGPTAARPKSDDPEEIEEPAPMPPVIGSPRPGEALGPGTHEVSGRGAPGMPLEILADGESKAQTTVGADGAWRAEIDVDSAPRLLAVRRTLGEAHPQAEVALAIPDVKAFASTAEAVPTERPTAYQVQEGDTLSGISARFNIKMSRLCQLNRLRDPDRILVGQTLRLRRS